MDYKSWMKNKMGLQSITERLNELEEKMLSQQKEIKELTRKCRRQELERIRLERKVRYYYYKGLKPEEWEGALAEWYQIRTGEELDYENPQNFNQKIQWIKMRGITPEMQLLVDKYRVRPWVKEKIGEQYLIPLIGVWERAEEIDFDQLPNQFVLKANHGCKWNIIVRDKRKLDVEDTRKKLKDWLSIDYAFFNGMEMQYHEMKPCIIAETYMENDNQELHDYKVYCFSGKPTYIQFMTDRKKKLRGAFFDTDWIQQPFNNRESVEEKITRPENLQELLNLSEKLSEGFPFARVDFYRLNDGSWKFGEMTFTPASGLSKWKPAEYNKILGDKIQL